MYALLNRRSSLLNEFCLQCIIPVFEGLLPPPHNDLVMELLFTLCDLHALAKLRMHTETTLAIMETTISHYGLLVRRFVARTCVDLPAKELPKEKAKKMWKKAGDIARGSTSQTAPRVEDQDESTSATAAPKKKEEFKQYNLARYKYHALGDIPAGIRLVGTADSHSSMLVSVRTR